MRSGTASARRPARRENAESSPADPTRAKLLAAGAEIFAERGYHAATVREICLRAGANIAAINYHFRDKLGLYTEVFRNAAGSVGYPVRPIFDRAAPPEQILRAVICAMIDGLYGRDRPALPFRLMRHELVQPTPALSQVVDEVIRPNYDRMRAIVGAIAGLPADHETTRLCAHSIMGQVLFYPLAGPVIGRLWPQMKMTPQWRGRIADHVTDFSLAYIRGIRGKP